LLVNGSASPFCCCCFFLVFVCFVFKDCVIKAEIDLELLQIYLCFEKTQQKQKQKQKTIGKAQVFHS